MAAKLLHPSLGEIHGRQGEGCTQFLGIKYASLQNNFAPSELYEHNKSNEVIDGTKLGPSVISSLGGIDKEFGFIQKSLPKPDLKISELDGLNLNITIPLIQGQLPKPEQKLPVFVWVHGGAFAVGSNSWPQMDQARIVKLSAELGLPVIGIGINYRLGLFGFLTSEEMRKSGYVANNGLRDQINAFRWIHKFIAGFGGDPESLAFIGQSAGGISGSLLLHSKEPLFKRLISMAGTSLMGKPLPPPVSEFAYASVVEALGLQTHSEHDRVDALVKAPVEKILALFPPFSLPLMPVVDGDLIPGPASFRQISTKANQPNFPLPGKKWCEELLIGDCQFDTSILAEVLGERKIGIAKSFCLSLEKSLASRPSGAEKLRRAYHITPDLSDPVALRNILQFATDIGFTAPAIAFAEGWPGKAYLYYFNEPNPWEGPWSGEATHILDVAFLFQNYSEFLEPAQKEIGIKLAGDFIKFINGKCEWPAFEDGKKGAQVYGPSRDGISSEYVEGVASERSGRKKTIFELGEEFGLDELSAVWDNFMMGN